MDLKEKVDNVINTIRPGLQSHGGDIELVEILEDEKALLVNLTGACQGCPMSTLTIKNFVEKRITEEIPEIKEVRLANG